MMQGSMFLSLNVQGGPMSSDENELWVNECKSNDTRMHMSQAIRNIYSSHTFHTLFQCSYFRLQPPTFIISLSFCTHCSFLYPSIYGPHGLSPLCLFFHNLFLYLSLSISLFLSFRRSCLAIALPISLSLLWLLFQIFSCPCPSDG